MLNKSIHSHSQIQELVLRITKSLPQFIENLHWVVGLQIMPVSFFLPYKFGSYEKFHNEFVYSKDILDTADIQVNSMVPAIKMLFDKLYGTIKVSDSVEKKHVLRDLSSVGQLSYDVKNNYKLA